MCNRISPVVQVFEVALPVFVFWVMFINLIPEFDAQKAEVGSEAARPSVLAIELAALEKTFEVALLESRPEGAATCQPRAPPWESDRVLRIATP
jgi:hypothetical protein